MMMNLFSIFDPSNSQSMSLNWLSLFLPIFFMPFFFWKIPSRLNFSWISISSSLTNEFKNNFSKTNNKNFFIFISLFWFILINNFLGLFPYIFTATSHLSVSLAFALTNWLIFMLYGWIQTTNNMFAHLVPLGTPMILANFMVLIETVSNIIRPITLSVRLSANMIAGHLLLSLLSGVSEKMMILYLATLPVLFALICLEIAVSMIQSYVFITLLTLYFNEI